MMRNSPSRLWQKMKVDTFAESDTLRSIMKTVSQPRPIFLGVAQLVEHAFWKREAVGTSPITQTTNQTTKTSTNNWRY